jgi:plastocyanin
MTDDRMPRSIPIAALLATIVLAAPSGLAFPRPQLPDSGGTVVGRVKLTTRIKGAALPSTAYPTRAVGAVDTHAIPEISNVVVYLKEVAFRGPATAGRVQLRQEHETFIPHVLAIQRGSTVDFPNDDPIFHNVFSLSSAASFDLRRYPRGQSRGWLFTKTGVVKVYCHIHSHMSATIVVLDHPYFTIPETDGTFTLSNLPPGDHTIVGWHERVGERRATVRVERGKTSNVDLSLPVEDPQ